MQSLIPKHACTPRLAALLTILLSNAANSADCIVTSKGKNLDLVVKISGTFDDRTGAIAKKAADAVAEAARDKLISIGQHLTCPSKIIINVEYSSFFAKDKFDTGSSEHQPASDSFFLSPWIDLSVNDDLINVTVSWNERQIIYDQRAVAAGVTPALERRTPIVPDDFARWCELYEDAIPLARSPEERADLILHSAKDVPPDVLWILQTSWQSTRAPFCSLVVERVREVLSASVDSYLSFLKHLILLQRFNPRSKRLIDNVSQLDAELADIYPRKNNDSPRRAP